ncbi:MAG: CD0415/CD1112 family protein [Defluviitaleaceae bacterium]|nr:CD0415/CD1112 family protein [Defluviitaleaceae bacterium]
MQFIFQYLPRLLDNSPVLFVFQWIINQLDTFVTRWLADMLVEGIISNIEGAFMEWDTGIDTVSGGLALTPENFFGGNFLNIIQGLSDNVVLPIAVTIFGIIVVYELMAMLAEGNNFSDFNYTHFVKWLVKIVIGVFLLTNVFPIINWIYSVGANAVIATSNVLNVDLFDMNQLLDAVEESLWDDYGVVDLVYTWLVSFLLRFFMIISQVAIGIIVYYRMFLILLKISIAAIPFATLINKEWGSVGNNYIKLIVASAFQGFLMMVVLGMYGGVMAGMLLFFPPTAEAINTGIFPTPDAILMAMFMILALSVMLIILLLKTQQISKSIFGAH